MLPYTSKSAERPQKRRRLRSTSGKRENRKRKHRSKERTPRKHHTRRHHSHDRRRLPRRRVRTSSSEFTETPGEFETSDITVSQYDSETCNFTDSSDSDYEQSTPPIIPFGSKAGDSVKKTLVRKIKREKFIELSELLPLTEMVNTPYTPNSYLQVDKNFNNRIRVTQNNRHKGLSFQQWSCAFNNFTVIYMKTHPQRNTTQTVNIVQDLMTYHNNIANLMKMGGDWVGYDRHFRKLRETNSHIIWGTMILDLQIHYSRPSSLPRVTYTKHNSNDKHAGPCLTYNSEHVFCRSWSCKYSHICRICKEGHPAYKCPQKQKPYNRKFTVPPSMHTVVRDSNRPGMRTQPQQRIHQSKPTTNHK